MNHCQYSNPHHLQCPPYPPHMDQYHGSSMPMTSMMVGPRSTMNFAPHMSSSSVDSRNMLLESFSSSSQPPSSMDPTAFQQVPLPWMAANNANHNHHHHSLGLQNNSSGGSGTSRRSSCSSSSSSSSYGTKNDDEAPRIPYPPNFVPTVHHVICGRGKKSYGHCGNKNFLSIVSQHIEEYSTCTTKQEKSDVVQTIVDTLEARGGFIRLDTQTGLYFPAEDGAGREKTSQALRDCLNHKYKSSKDIKRKNRKEKRLAKQAVHDHVVSEKKKNKDKQEGSSSSDDEADTPEVDTSSASTSSTSKTTTTKKAETTTANKKKSQSSKKQQKNTKKIEGPSPPPPAPLALMEDLPPPKMKLKKMDDNKMMMGPTTSTTPTSRPFVAIHHPPRSVSSTSVDMAAAAAAVSLPPRPKPISPSPVLGQWKPLPAAPPMISMMRRGPSAGPATADHHHNHQVHQVHYHHQELEPLPFRADEVEKLPDGMAPLDFFFL